MHLTRAILLSLFLLFAQQGSMLHVLDHAFAAHKKHESPAKTASCEKCISYSAVGSAVNSAYVTLNPGKAATSDFIQYNQNITKIPAPHPVARGPPGILL
jgi:hypothetical protein